MFGDVHFKQWVVIEILVAGKKLVTNIHTQNVYNINAVDYNTVS